jgi:hypothetical protein
MGPMMVRHLYVVGNYLFRFRHLLDVVRQDALQNLDGQNLDELLPFLDEVLLVVVLVDVELHHRLRKDYFQDEVGVELRHLLRMDYFQDEERLGSQVLRLELQVSLQMLLRLPQPLPLPAQPFQHHVMP